MEMHNSQLAEETLYQDWVRFTAENEPQLFHTYVDSFLKVYHDFVDIDLCQLSEGFMPDGPHLTKLPEELLPTIFRHLGPCRHAYGTDFDPERLRYAEQLVQMLIVICRNADNVVLVASCEFVTQVVAMSTIVQAKLSSGNVQDDRLLSSFVKHSLHFLECLYDPYFVWKKETHGWRVDGTWQRFQPALLHVEVIPYFYECFHRLSLDVDIQIRLLHMFGAVISGSQQNALRAICPASLDILLEILSNEAAQPVAPPGGSGGGQSAEPSRQMQALVLRCIVSTLRCTQACSADKRQLEVSAVLDGYLKVLLKVNTTHCNQALLMSMLDAICTMMVSGQRAALQLMFVVEGIFTTLVRFLIQTTLSAKDAQALGISVIKVMNTVMAGSAIAKEKFRKEVGYSRFVEALKSLGQPSHELLETLLHVVLEEKFQLGNSYPIRNPQAVLMLIEWLPDIESLDLQLWLSTCVRSLCASSTHNAMLCCNEGMIATILSVLARHRQIDSKAIGNLIVLLESLGSVSMRASELRQLIHLLRRDEQADSAQNRYSARLVRAMSHMARRDETTTAALHYLCFSEKHAGIAIPSIQRWPGTGFSFHAWLCLDIEPPDGATRSRRHQLYSFLTSAGNGFEAFFTADGILVVAVCIKKEYHTVAVTDWPIRDQCWHCVAVVHAASRRPFTQSQLCVYIDGELRLTTDFKLPSLTESFVSCEIGCVGDRAGGGDGDVAASPRSSRLHMPALPFRWSLSSPLRRSASQSCAVATVPAGSQDDQYGTAVAFTGQIGSLYVLQEALLAAQVRALHHLGPNCLTLFCNEEHLAELSPKILLYYSAKACEGPLCLDLSSNQLHGKLVGEKCVTWDIKDVINCLGGIQILFPLLEQVDHTRPAGGDLIDLTAGQSPPPQPSPPPASESDWVMVANSSYDDSQLELNAIAGFITLLRNMLWDNVVNQETMVRQHAVATLGALLQKVALPAVDVHVLMSLQLLVESTQLSSTKLRHQMYQYLMFDFRIWSCSEFTVRIGHIQYLSTMIKDDKTFFRKKYGVQYILDIIRMYYSCPEDSQLSEADGAMIRASLFGLVKFYVSRSITAEELGQVIVFVLAEQQPRLVCEALQLLIGLLEGATSHGGRRPDQLYPLMFEADAADQLYALLTRPRHAVEVKEKVVRVLTLLLDTDKVYDKSKVRLRLWEGGLFSGLASLMADSTPTATLVTGMLTLVLLTDTSASYNAALSILQFICRAAVSVKLAAVQQVLRVVLTRPVAASLIARQRGWQEVLVRLLIDAPNPTAPSPLRPSSGAVFPSPDSPPVSSPDAPPPPPPRFTFADETTYDEDWFGTASSRSSSASIEDVARRLAPPGGGAANRTSTASTASDGGGSTTPTPTLTPTPTPTSPVLPKPASPPVDATDIWMEVSVILTRMGIVPYSYRNDPAAVRSSEEDLVELLIVMVFLVQWKGLEGTPDQLSTDRGQVFAAINYTRERNALMKTPSELNRRILELTLQGCIADLKEAGQTNATYTGNAMDLVRLVYNFLCLDEGASSDHFTESIIEDVLALLDLLTVWELDTEWHEMRQLGLTILLEFAAQPNIELCSIAAARLHNLLQTRPVDKLQESCFVMASVYDIINTALNNNSEHYNFLIPVMKALVDKCTDLLNMKTYLPRLPATQLSPTFFEDFKAYCCTEEWHLFMRKQVVPSKEEYVSNRYDRIKVAIKTQLGLSHEQMMLSSHRRSRDRGDSKLRVQTELVDAVRTRVRREQKRYHSLATQLRNQNASALRQWRSNRTFLTGERGAWFDPAREQTAQHWKLCNQENFSRMRPKLILNYNFDSHIDPSRLRDNLTVEAAPVVDLNLINIARVSDDEIGDDRLGDEEWNLISAVSTVNEETSTKEKLVLTEDCELVTVMQVVSGRLEVTTSHVYFFDCSQNRDEGCSEDFKWSLSQLREIHFRRYNLRRSALEFFLINQSNYFINFQKKVRNRVYSRILNLRPAHLIYYGSRSPAEMLKASGLTQKWVQREISNFEYLIQLNTIAGRTYNDLSQYPVFPWILSDYTSETLDLDDPKVYRDLSRPIGVVNKKNEAEVRGKYENFEDPSGMIEKFHYGTHYSNAAGVMHYLLRLEPFTTLHIDLQSGRFDVADRQFHSIGSSWSSLMNNPNDVKELIPEFFYLPEFLLNKNGFDLGKLQGTGGVVDDVRLPPWAASADDFIQKHMKALESEHVSRTLHKWIDLIFGQKQKGAAAVEALNVFYYCTYEGAVDLDAVTNLNERKALEGMINNFGQTPCQLLKEAHPQRMRFDEMVTRASKMDRSISLLFFLNHLKTFYVEAAPEDDPLVYVSVPRNQARSFIQHGMPDTMIGVTESGSMVVHGWLPYDKAISNYFTFERDSALSTAKTKRRIAGPFAPGIVVSARLFATSHDAKLLYSGGHWDNSLRVYSLAKQKMVGCIVRHTDIVTCVTLDMYGKHLMTGSRDTTCMIWAISLQSGGSSVESKPPQILYGHTDEVTCIALCVELDLAVSGSKDGTVNVHTVHRGTYVRTLRPPCETRLQMVIQQVALSDVGHMCLCCRQHAPGRDDRQEKLDLHLYSVNGDHLSSETLLHSLAHMAISRQYLVFGTTSGILFIKELFGLRTVTTVPLHIPVTCVSITHNNSHIFAGLKDGKLIIFGTKRLPEAK